MNLHETDVVRAEDERPARRDGTCFYCRQPLGALHKPTCVIVSKTVVIRVVTDVVVRCPRDWTPENVNFHYNESSSCGSNILRYIGAWAEDNCACGSLDVTHQREATEKDHEILPVIDS